MHRAKRERSNEGVGAEQVTGSKLRGGGSNQWLSLATGGVRSRQMYLAIFIACGDTVSKFE